MPENNPSEDRGISRRRLLQRTGSTVGLLSLGSARVAADDSDDTHGTDCPEPTIGPGITHYDASIQEVCSDDHPETQAIQADVRASLEKNYPTVGALIEAGFIPYFDFFAEGSWSHWINPEFIGDDSVVDPTRPESILVDHTWWRPIGVMFIATDEGGTVDPPPPSYVDESKNDQACTPWHAHIGLPGRYAWWKYKATYEDSFTFPCRTPWMMHVWRYPHPHSIYGHAAPDERGGPPAEPPGFDTDANTDKADLGPEHLPDIVQRKVEGLW